MPQSKYAQRGVSSQKEDVHNAIQKLDKGLFPNAFCKILPDLAAGDKYHCNIMHTDTAGTKTALAYLYWRETGDNSVWKGIIQDALVMNIDDMACAGATGDIIVSSSIGRNKNLIPGEVLKHLIEGTVELIEEWNALGISLHLAGGETADVGDVVRTLDVGFTAFTRLKRAQVIDINIQPGDVIVGLASSGKATYEKEYNSGMGCNGLTSARHDVLGKYLLKKYPETFDPKVKPALLYSGSKKLTDKDKESGMTIGKLLLSPTRTFFPLIKAMLHTGIKTHGIVHCSGGGQTKVMKFAPTVRIIKDDLFETPHVFQLIQRESKTPWREMYEVFNMGHRMEIYTEGKNVTSIMNFASRFGIGAQIIGRVERAQKKELVIKSPHGQFTY
ncbi:MAG: AIR synthase-related protein [Chitinophagales bacterium]|nr:AIR synthase-related protein [Chitinophagales bacterium]